MKPPSTRRKPISPAEAADKLEFIKDTAEDLHGRLNDLLNDYQVSSLAAPSVIQARRLVKHSLEHLSLSIEVLEREVK